MQRDDYIIINIFLWTSLILIGEVRCVTGASKKETQINRTENENICNTTACRDRAKLITDLLNDDIDPCTDFYGYVCNNWIFKNPIPDDRTITSNLYDIEEQVLKDLKDILENTTYKTNCQNVTDKAVIAYRNCVNTSIPTAAQFHALQRLLGSVGGQYWPISPAIKNQSAVPNWYDLYIKIHNEMDLHLLFIVAVFKDPTNVTYNVVSFDVPSPGSAAHQIMSVSEETKLTPEQIAYLKLMGSSIKTFYPEVTTRETLTIMQDIIWFEGNITKIHREAKNKSGRGIHFVKKTVTELSNISEKLDWKAFLNKIFESVRIKLEPNEPVVLSDEFYIREIVEFVSNSSRSTVYNYLMWRVILNFGQLALPRFRQMVFEMSRISTGAKKDYPLWMHCVDAVAGSEGVMDQVVGRLYVQRKFSADAKQDINDLVTELADSFKERLERIRWMDKKTKLHSMRKLSHMVRHVAYPDWMMNDTYLNDLYLGVGPVALGTPFLVSYMDFRKQGGLQNLRELRETNNRKEDWASGPAIVNAFYSPQSNSITFPAGILRAPLFEYGLPMHMNLGAIGTIIGHEITHAFDDTGSQFDEEGNYKNWWTNATKQKFLRKVKCFEEEYGSIVDNRVHLKLDGVQSKGENIADNGGLGEAYRAYRRWAAKTTCREAPSLPGLNLTSDQLFFVSFALTWCTNPRPKKLVSQIRYDPHCPARYRVNEPLRNTKEFSKAFSCKKSSRMNKKDKCILW